MHCELNYGRGRLRFEIPAGAKATVFRKRDMPVLDDPASAVESALDSPVACDRLEDFAAGKRSAAIAICDITRPVPNHLFLRPLVERLERGGVPRANISILVATGLHGPNEGEDLAEIIGDPWILDNVAILNHFAERDEEHVDLGRTPTRGTAVKLDRRFVEADVKIATGLVEPHFMAGYSGGRKVIAPGLAHAETITTFHNHAFMADGASRNCNLLGNPLHEEQLEIVKMLGGALALNTVIDEDRRLSFVNFGEIVASHDRAVEYVAAYCRAESTRKYHTVVTSGAGHPLDGNYYQTVKGMVGAMGVLAEGGDLIIASECARGLGSAHFAASQRRLLDQGRDAFLAAIARRSHAHIDEWQTQMQTKPMAIGRVSLYSDGLKGEERSLTGVEMIDSLDDAVAASVARHGDAEIAVIPEGPYVIPVCDHVES